jgi:hypothetical protein
MESDLEALFPNDSQCVLETVLRLIAIVVSTRSSWRHEWRCSIIVAKRCELSTDVRRSRNNMQRARGYDIRLSIPES